MFNGKIIVLLLAITPSAFSKNVSYCDSSLCPEGKKHIACNNTGNFSPDCQISENIPMTPDYRKVILRKHNIFRNVVAKGFKNFPTARRMATMLWSDTLSKLAELYVKQCKLKRDQCYNTHKYPFIGQNVGIMIWSGWDLNVTEVIGHQIRAWIKEHENCPVHVIDKYKPSTDKPYNSFTAMLHDKSTHLGCAILRSYYDGFVQQVMSCIYAYGNVVDVPVYTKGPTGHRCRSGRNRYFKNLCSVKENYNTKTKTLRAEI